MWRSISSLNPLPKLRLLRNTSKIKYAKRSDKKKTFIYTNMYCNNLHLKLTLIFTNLIYPQNLQLNSYL